MKRKTRDRILDASLELFNADGESNVTTLQIADEIDISPGNLYYHFKSKSEIVTELYDRYEHEIQELLAVPEVEISVDDEEIVERLSGRRIHEPSGRVYHVKHMPPKEDGKDDETGEPLIQRDDDKEETVRKRLQVYREETEPLVRFYQDLEAKNPGNAPHYVRVEGVGSTESIRDRIIATLKG